MDTCRNECFIQMDDHPVHTTPNHPKIITFLQIVLAAKWIVRHSTTYLGTVCISPKQHRRPVPSSSMGGFDLMKHFCCACAVCGAWWCARAGCTWACTAWPTLWSGSSSPSSSFYPSSHLVSFITILSEY